MPTKRPQLARLLRMSAAWQRLVGASPGEIDEALRFLDFHERRGRIGPREAAGWRWKVMACWAELHRRRLCERKRGGVQAG